MRKPQNSRRGRGRNSGGRSAGNNRQQRRSQNPANRVYESQGPDGRVKGTPAQLYERYRNAAREVQGNDRVLAESLLQFADHYYRLSAEGQDEPASARPRPAAETAQNDQTMEPVEGESAPEGAADTPETVDGAETLPPAQERVTEEQIPVLRRRRRSTKAVRDTEDAPATDARSGADAGAAPRDTESTAETTTAPRRRDPSRKTDAGSAAVTEADGTEQPAPRRRGRPKKTEPSETDQEAREAASSGQAVSDTTTTQDDEQPVRRRRGRPRKVVEEAESEATS